VSDVDPTPAQLAALVAGLRRDVEALQAAAARAHDDGPADDEDDDPGSVYPDVAAWVAGWLAPRISRRPDTHLWCARWDLHPEAVDVLTAAWESWEASTGADRLAWFERFYTVWAVLTDADGTFWQCTVPGAHQGIAGAPQRDTRHSPGRPLLNGAALAVVPAAAAV